MKDSEKNALIFSILCIISFFGMVYSALYVGDFYIVAFMVFATMCFILYLNERKNMIEKGDEDVNKNTEK